MDEIITNIKLLNSDDLIKLHKIIKFINKYIKLRMLLMENNNESSILL